MISFSISREKIPASGIDSFDAEWKVTPSRGWNDCASFGDLYRVETSEFMSRNPNSRGYDPLAPIFSRLCIVTHSK